MAVAAEALGVVVPGSSSHVQVVPGNTLNPAKLADCRATATCCLAMLRARLTARQPDQKGNGLPFNIGFPPQRRYTQVFY